MYQSIGLELSYSHRFLLLLPGRSDLHSRGGYLHISLSFSVQVEIAAAIFVAINRPPQVRCAKSGSGGQRRCGVGSDGIHAHFRTGRRRPPSIAPAPSSGSSSLPTHSAIAPPPDRYVAPVAVAAAHALAPDPAISTAPDSAPSSPPPRLLRLRSNRRALPHRRIWRPHHRRVSLASDPAAGLFPTAGSCRHSFLLASPFGRRRQIPPPLLPWPPLVPAAAATAHQRPTAHASAGLCSRLLSTGLQRRIRSCPAVAAATEASPVLAAAVAATRVRLAAIARARSAGEWGTLEFPV